MIGFSGAARVAGVIGSPVRHSLSPLIHNAWIAAAGLDAVYVPYGAEPDTFVDVVRGLELAGLKGLNVTLPFKRAALAYAERADVTAQAAGAANLLVFGEEGQVEARNTDGIGLLAAFAAQAPDWRPDAGPVLILGAGGAARGAAAALAAAGVAVLLTNRTLARAHALADALPGLRVVEHEDIPSVLADTAALVNATSAGLTERERIDVPLQFASPQMVVMDMVYAPLRTALLRQAEALGLRTVDGLAMLIGQAAPSFQALFNQPPPMDVDVRALALRALGDDAA